MNVHCPKCGSRQLRQASCRNFGERLGSWLGSPPIRCMQCSYRFRTAVWRLFDLLFARCPRCYGMELGSWDLKHYNARGLTRLLVTIGARRVRCDRCRHNFVSFRPRKRFGLRTETGDSTAGHAA